MLSARTLAVTALIATTTCNQDAERIGATRQAQTIAPYAAIAAVPFQPGPSFFATSEPSGAFANSGTLVGGMNGAFNTGAARSWFVATVAANTVTITRVCDLSGPPAGTAGCVPVPTANIPGFVQWGGDPTIVSDGRNNVVMIGLADTNNASEGTAGEEIVVASVSTNAGQSFTFSGVVNDNGCGTGGYVQDQPGAVFDYTTSPPTLWVVWRHRRNSLEASYGTCIRRGVIDTGRPGGVHWLGPNGGEARVVEGIGTGNFFVGMGGVRVVAGDGVVTVAYSSSAFIFTCPSSNTAAIDWGTVDSFDNGQNWTDNAKIYDSGAFRWCVLGSPPTALVGLRSFDIARAPGGIEYAVVATGGLSSPSAPPNEVRFFMSPAAGVKGWQNPTSTIRTWFEWCPGTPVPSKVPNGPTRNWINVETQGKCPTPAFTGAGPSVLMPTIATDGRGRVAITYYESDPGDSQLRVILQANENPQDPAQGFVKTGLQLGRPLTGFFPLPSFSNGVGDYMAIAVRPTETSLQVPFTGGCTTKNEFFPLWVQNPACPACPVPVPSSAQVATTGVVLAP